MGAWVGPGTVHGGLGTVQQRFGTVLRLKGLSSQPRELPVAFGTVQ